MTHGTGSASLVRAMGEQVPDCFTVSANQDSAECPEKAMPDGRRVLHTLTPEQRQSAIERAGCAMEAAYAKFKQSHSASDLDRAHHHMRQLLTLAGLQAQA